MTRRLHAALPALALLAIGLLLAGPVRAAPTNAAFTADLSQGKVVIVLRAEPAQVRMDRDFIVTLRVSAPEGLQVKIPDLRDRFRGFRSADGFSLEPATANGVTQFEQRWRLVPDLLRTYRLAPFAVEVREGREPGAPTSSFATRPVAFPAEPPPETVSGSPEVNPKPYWIPPTPRTVALWIGFLVLLAGFAVALFHALRLLQRTVRERRMSPRERAFAELERLLRRHLVDKRLYKDFYVELTMVVRRYIERAHEIRAPEQTTQEFLAAAMVHPHFSPDTLARLRSFLESADLVKFAGQEATPAMADGAVASARDYVTTDDERRKAETGSRKADPRAPGVEPHVSETPPPAHHPPPAT